MNTSITIRIYIIFTALVALWCAGILAAPVLKHTGLNGSADIAYSVFSRVCHQNDARSFHVEGEKLGVCIRCSAIYFGFLAGLLFMPLSGVLKRMQMPKPMMIIAVLIPMALDVVLNDTGLYASTTMTRAATGLLFGSVMPWCIVPLLIEACTQLIYRHRQKKKIHSPDSGVYTYDRKTQ
jgi:uncharacterized membrane protein